MFRDLDAGTYRAVYIVTGYTDLRFGIDGLAAVVQHKYELDPFDKDTLFLFCGRRADRIKGLLWEMDSCCYTNDWKTEDSVGPGMNPKRKFFRKSNSHG